MSSHETKWWSRTRWLMIGMLIIWIFFGFAIHLFADSLNHFDILGFPGGFYMASQGSLIVFVLMTFWFSSRQDAIDREFGQAEDD